MGDNTGWGDSPGSECDWAGVLCDAEDQHVTGLHLMFNNLVGQLPAALDALTHVEQLRLEGNELSGEIPGELAALERLETLRLDRNHLSGEIPRSSAT